LTGGLYIFALVLASVHSVVHWADNGGYNFVSGPLADITLATAFFSWLYLFLRHHNCHVQGCWRLEFHPHPDHGHPVCRHHYPHADKIKA
jgi:hypothetical protein